MKIPFSPPYIDESVKNEVMDSLNSGWITTGPKVKALEGEVMKLTGVKAALGVNSWTSGTIMMLRWFGIGPDDEVIIPAYTYCATAMAVMWAGAKVVMVDSAEDFNASENIRGCRVLFQPEITTDPSTHKRLKKMIQGMSFQSAASLVNAKEIEERDKQEP